jgi:hypothetical protein
VSILERNGMLRAFGATADDARWYRAADLS